MLNRSQTYVAKEKLMKILVCLAADEGSINFERDRGVLECFKILLFYP